MNAVDAAILAGNAALIAARIEEARTQAHSTKRRVIEVLEENLELAPGEFTLALAGVL